MKEGVTSFTNNRINTYDISGATATCLSSVTLGTDTPHAILEHSNTYLYYATQNNDQIYRANPDGSNSQVIFSTNLLVLNNPTSMIELPNGDILVASSTLPWESQTRAGEIRRYITLSAAGSDASCCGIAGINLQYAMPVRFRHIEIAAANRNTFRIV